MTEDIAFTIDGQIATITLNRPQKLNAVTPDMADAIRLGARALAEADPSRPLSAASLEIALLDRTRARRAFRRVSKEEVEAALASSG